MPSGFKPVASIRKFEKNGMTFVNLQITCGHKSISFDPEWWDDLADSGDAIHDAAVRLKGEIINGSTDDAEG